MSEKTWAPMLPHYVRGRAAKLGSALTPAERAVVRAEYPDMRETEIDRLGWFEVGRCDQCGEMFDVSNPSCERQAWDPGLGGGSIPGHPRVGGSR